MKVTLAGTVGAYLDANPGDHALETLLSVCQHAGLAVTEAQVYAGVQSMASTGKCGRGHGKRTYCRLIDTDPDRVVTPGVASPRRVAKVSHYPNELIFEALTEALGLPVTRPQYDKLFAVLLLGEDSPEFILERAEIVLKHPPTKWSQWKVGSNDIIGFHLEVPDA